MKFFLKILIRGYRLFGEVFRWLLGGQSGACCRFTPTCSEYAEQAVEEHGVWKGSLLALKRVLRCHPWGAFGYDPVPHKIKE